MTKDAYYFSHDSNARHDPKILAMRSVFGLEGYGRYWVLIEILREQESYKLKKAKHLFNALGMQLQCDSNAAEIFVSDCINEFDLLQEDEEFIWCNSLIKRMQIKDEKSDKARKAAEIRWSKSRETSVTTRISSDIDTNVMQPHNESTAIKGKESKRKESKNIKDYTSEIKNFLSRYPDGFSELNKAYWNVIRETRSSKKIQNSVICNMMEKWTHYPQIVVEFSLKRHIEIGSEKDEKYTIGIMRKTTKEEAIYQLDRMQPKGVIKSETDVYDNLF